MDQFEVIEFYRVADEYGYFSNFAAYPIMLQRELWPTSEHYFQAQKFEDQHYRERIRQAESPMIAAKLGRSRQEKLRDDWESIKTEVMREALRAKFAQHQTLRDHLLATGNARIVEHTSNDNFWGDGGDGSGKNMLGRLLMEVREELQVEC